MTADLQDDSAANGESRSPGKTVWQWALRAIGILLFAIILSRINVRRTAEILLHQNALVLLGALALFVPQTVARAWRWHVLLSANGCNLRRRELVRSVLDALFWGTVTPGRVGEFAKAGAVRRTGHSWGLALGASALERLLDLGVVVVVAIVAALLLGTAAVSGHILWVVCVAAAVGAGIVVAALTPQWQTLALKLPGIRQYQARLGNELGDFRAALVAPVRKNAVRLLLLTAILWLLAYLEIYVFARNIGITVTFFYLVVTVSLASVLTLLPISISGLGTRDAAYILLLGARGVSAESAVALAAMVLLMFVFNGVVSWAGAGALRPHPPAEPGALGIFDDARYAEERVSDGPERLDAGVDASTSRTSQ